MDKSQFILPSNARRTNIMYASFDNSPMLNMTISNSIVGNSHDPDIFGPPFWFVLHNAANSYPRRPTLWVCENMKQLLTTLPLLVPCINCKEHFYDFLKTVDLNKVVSSKENLFAFFVDTHNYVNKRYGKKEMSLEAAKELYGFDKPTGSNIRITYV